MTQPSTKNNAKEMAQSVMPTVDLSAFLSGTQSEQDTIARQVDETCQLSGFLIIKNHGVADSTLKDAWDTASRFFALPIEKKMATRSSDPNCPRGYFPPQSETLSKSRGIVTPPDQKEAFSSGPLLAPNSVSGSADFDFHYGQNAWPAEPADFRDVWIRYYQAMEELGSQLMSLFAAALQLQRDYFVEFHTHHISALRALNYPSTDAVLMPGQQRAGAHSDYGSLTILRPDFNVGGLEIQLPSGGWLPAPLIENTFVINIGDMMARWTNDRWVSTVHRVVSPPVEDGGLSQRRQSIAYFHNPNFDADINCIPTCLADGATMKYPSVQAGQYLYDRFSSAV
jgi:isopenicillin N synthase-like dioxygenase